MFMQPPSGVNMLTVRNASLDAFFMISLYSMNGKPGRDHGSLHKWGHPFCQFSEHILLVRGVKGSVYRIRTYPNVTMRDLPPLSPFA